MTVDQLLATLAECQVTLFLSDNDLRYRAPAGALTPALRKTIIQYRDAIVAQLCRQQRAITNGTTKCAICVWPCWVDEPPRNGRVRTVCSKCGRFIGYRPEKL